MNFDLTFDYPPGDCWCLTRLVHDFAQQFPADSLAPLTPCAEIFDENPYFRTPQPGAIELKFTFSESRTASMVSAMYDFIEAETGRAVRMDCSAPEFFLTDDEKSFSLVPLNKPVCVLNAGWKCDNPCKYWGFDNFCAVVAALASRVTFVQVGAIRNGTDFHKRVPGALDFRGKTNLRELAQLVYHADFVLTGVSQLHHLAGIQAYKPRTCITIAGGREPENWANCHARAGVKWHWLTGDACAEAADSPHGGCWKHDCSDPVCMNSITPENVVEIFERSL